MDARARLSLTRPQGRGQKGAKRLLNGVCFVPIAGKGPSGVGVDVADRFGCQSCVRESGSHGGGRRADIQVQKIAGPVRHSEPAEFRDRSRAPIGGMTFGLQHENARAFCEDQSVATGRKREAARRRQQS